MAIPKLYRDILICLFAWLGGVGYATGNWYGWAMALAVTLLLVLKTKPGKPETI